MGRGVVVPKLGIFTFTPPEVRLKVVYLIFRVLRTRIKGTKSRGRLYS